VTDEPGTFDMDLWPMLAAAQRRACAARTIHVVTKASAELREQLGDLAYVAWILAGFFDSRSALSWWQKPNHALQEQSPAACWFAGDRMRAKVIQVAELLA
jgi:hypothetical protein